MNIKTLLLAAVALVAAGCNKSESQIEEETASGVVLVQNQSYYEVVLSNGESLYFTGFDEDGDMDGLAFEEDSVSPVIGYGTGFFVSGDGKIATNAHVVSNQIEDRKINKSVKTIIEGLKSLVELAYDKHNEELEETQELYDYANYSDEVSYADFYKIRDYKESLEKKIQECVEVYEALDDIDPKDSEITYHNRVSIAYNDTYITELGDFQSCVVGSVDAEHDLAIIQLKDKSTPIGRHIFSIPEADPLEEYSTGESIAEWFEDDKNSKLLMSSFNLGPTLALTNEGIKSQFNSGSVSQKTEGRIMYSIPTLPGSSGSPVVNLRGELVAVNFAGIQGTQNFNYGIRVKHLRNLLDQE